MRDLIEIDGSYGEGGGQILRTSLSLSCLLGRPFRIFNIRKGRKNPGLMPQHLVAVKAMELISSAEVTGAQIGSTELIFKPERLKPGGLFYDIKTAGSTMLVLQTLLPCLIFSEEPHSILLKGGTHVPFSPSFHYVKGVFLQFLRRIGIRLELSIEEYGFYPKGGGLIKGFTEPVRLVSPLRLLEPGRLIKVRGISAVANLPAGIAERQKQGFLERMKEEGIPAEIETEEVRSIGQGTFIYIEAILEDSIAGFTGIGERGKRAEIVGEETAEELIRYLKSGKALDPHMADQILLYLSLTEDESVFTTSEITSHLLTNLWVIKRFMEIDYAIDGEKDKPGAIRIKGRRIR